MEKKLGREAAHGMYVEGTNVLYVDPRQREKQRLMVTLHEWMHRHDLASADAHARMEDGDEAAGRAIEEADVADHSRDLADLLWRLGYRRVRL
ncbi:MAG: hypothetical protein FGM22_08365 [Burkholderiaceae bacterium]|nr:hypothetical protein [Burkholderiaceae bacterium]